MRGDERGFTFVEVLVVMVVLAAGIAGFLQSALLAERLRDRSRLLAASALLAESALERIGALGWDGSVGELPRETLPGLLDEPGPLPVLRVEQDGAIFLLVHERTDDGAGLPLVAVRCFWSRGAAGFRRRDGVAFATRLP